MEVSTAHFSSYRAHEVDGWTVFPIPPLCSVTRDICYKHSRTACWLFGRSLTVLWNCSSKSMCLSQLQFWRASPKGLETSSRVLSYLVWVQEPCFCFVWIICETSFLWRSQWRHEHLSPLRCGFCKPRAAFCFTVSILAHISPGVHGNVFFKERMCISVQFCACCDTCDQKFWEWHKY